MLSNKENVFEITIKNVIQRRIGTWLSDHIVVKELDEPGDVFEIECKNGILTVWGTNEISMLSGIHWFIKYYCKSHLSWCGDNILLYDKLPETDRKVRKENWCEYRYAFNYCTFSYSMAFWDWNRWERELDLLALNGVNLMLCIVGQETVIRNTFLRLGYSADEISEFICGPAYFAWMWMGNMTNWGGPLTDNWFEHSRDLALKIKTRCKELGIKLILPGFYGIVPFDFKNRFPEAEIVDQGEWCNFKRPPILSPIDKHFKQVSEIFYDEQKKLFGTGNFYSADPFHEGGNHKGIDLEKCASSIHSQMLKSDPNSKWVLQAWQGNPEKQLLNGVVKDKAIILDLFCESQPMWKTLDAFEEIPWIWCMIQNFGGNNGMHGSLEKIIEDIREVKGKGIGMKNAGIGIIPEGIETNPVVYELILELGWYDEVPDLMNWISEYLQRRYGSGLGSSKKAWELLCNSVYDCRTGQQGASESLICARPSDSLESVSAWGTAKRYYHPTEVETVLRLLFQDYEVLKKSDAYLYDLVDVGRQVIAERFQITYDHFQNSLKNQNSDELEQEAATLLKLIKQLDELLSTRKEFMIGKYIEEARAIGKNEIEKDLYEFNLKTLITLWGDKKASDCLHDYSNREWNGLVGDFYLARWNLYLQKRISEVKNGEQVEDIDWYNMEHQWTRESNQYESDPQGNIKQCIEEILFAKVNIKM